VTGRPSAPFAASPRFLRFLMVGVFNTGVNYGIYALFIFAGLGYIAAATLSFAVGLVVSFRTHSRYVFDAGGVRAFFPYVVSWLAIYLLHITVLMSSPNRKSGDPSWRERCGEVFCELRSYLAGSVVMN